MTEDIDLDAIREALEPVLHWYQSDEHPDRSTAEIVRDIVADAQRDRAAIISVQRIAQRTRDARAKGAPISGYTLALDVLEACGVGVSPSQDRGRRVMETHAQLVRRARRIGYEITPTLDAELRVLASVPDEKLRAAARNCFVKQIAEDFRVPPALAEVRLKGIGPFLPRGGDD